jgi:hypothetical protein
MRRPAPEKILKFFFETNFRSRSVCERISKYAAVGFADCVFPRRGARDFEKSLFFSNKICRAPTQPLLAIDNERGTYVARSGAVNR